jgi:hypothetical protein
MSKKTGATLLLLLLSLGIIFFFSETQVPIANASPEDFFLGSSTLSKLIWSSSSPEHLQITVTVTGAMADAYSDTQLSSVTVKSDNNEVTLFKGESQTFEDTTDSVWLYENAGYDHNYHSYYGISGTWEITNAETGPLGFAEGSDNFILSAIIVFVVVIVIIGLIFLVRNGRLHPSEHSHTVYPPPPPPPN